MKLTDTKSISRESNIELLRILLMLMIISYHFLIHGADMGDLLSNYNLADPTSVVYILMKSFLVIAVNCFVFISGFFRINFKFETLLILLMQVIFYGLLFTLAADLASLQPFSIFNYVKSFLLLFTGVWWFITAYVALYLISPLLNAAVDALSKRKFLMVVINLTILNTVFGFFFGPNPIGAKEGLSLISFINIYLLGQYIKKYVDLEQLKQYALPIYIFTSLGIALLAIASVVVESERGIEKAFDYNNPLVIISAIAFFFVFKKIKLQSEFINKVSPYVLGVYLFHDHPLMRIHLIETLYKLSFSNIAAFHFVKLFAMALLVFILGYGIDKVREFLAAPLTKTLTGRLNSGIFKDGADFKLSDRYR